MPPASPQSGLVPAVVIAVYNHAPSARRVVEGALAELPLVVVVDDGSTDGLAEVLAGLPVELVRHGKNLGKGAAILSGAARARALGASHIITVDADGQHDPRSIRSFLPLMAAEPLALIVGSRDFDTPNVPASSRFGRAFSNFWLRVQTGCRLSDVQSGFRAYPLAALEVLRTTETRYAFEVEVLVRAAWAGFPLRQVEIPVYYPPRGERVSHFKALADNLRISLLNTRLTMRAMLPWPHRTYAGRADGTVSVLHPVRSLRLLLAGEATPLMLGLSAALGMLLGTLPLVGLHSIGILFCAGYWRLSKLTALAVSQLCMPPLLPALCVEAGYYLRHGRFLTEFSLATLGYEAPQRLLEWLLGSLVVGPVLALVLGLTVFLLALPIQRALKRREART